MSRTCDFCLRSEDDVRKLCEVKHRGLNKHGEPKCVRHICLDCARDAVTVMEKSMGNEIEGGKS